MSKPSIAEQKPRLEAKFAEAYRRARERIRDETEYRLVEQLDSSQENSPTTTWHPWHEGFCAFENDGCFEDLTDRGYTEAIHGWNGEMLEGAIDQVTWRRALRDELAYRRNREFIHEQLEYDS